MKAVGGVVAVLVTVVDLAVAVLSVVGSQVFAAEVVGSAFEIFEGLTCGGNLMTGGMTGSSQSLNRMAAGTSSEKMAVNVGGIHGDPVLLGVALMTSYLILQYCAVRRRMMDNVFLTLHDVFAL